MNLFHFVFSVSVKSLILLWLVQVAFFHFGCAISLFCPHSLAACSNFSGSPS